MSLSPGTRLGPYEVTAQIGQGGMGEVYRARDMRLDRLVAIKIVKSAPIDSDLFRRFEIEAKAAGNLNHPNILAIYDIGTHDGVPYLVSELLEGQSLDARLGLGPVPPKKAISYLIQIADGLAAVQSRGFVHRDLKPSNLFLTNDGRVKILDFGLVKLLPGFGRVGRTGSGSTTTVDTGADRIVGTVGYMSPEQVSGGSVDHRSDLFQLGAVGYEMLTGRRAFKEASDIETMSAILGEEPPEDPAAFENVPPGVELAVRRCLEKNPDERFQSARDLGFYLSTLPTSSGSGVTQRVRATSGRSVVRLAVTAVVAVVIAGGAFLLGEHAGLTPAPSYQQITFRRGTIRSARFAPDGRTIIYGASWDGAPTQLFSTRLESPESSPLRLPTGDIRAISASGELAISLGPAWLGTLARVPLEGGGPREIVTDVETADWGPDGESLAVARLVESIYRLGFPVGTVLYEASGWISQLRVSPDGNRVAFIEHPVKGDDLGSVCVISLSGEKRVMSANWPSVTGLAWAASGEEIWFTAAEAGSNTGLYAVDLSGRQRLVTRSAGHLDLQDIAPDGRVLLAHGTYRIAMSSRAPEEESDRDLSWLGASVAAGLSADGDTALFMEQAFSGKGLYVVYLRKLDGSPPVRLGEGLVAALSPDGRWAATIGLGPPAEIAVVPTGPGARHLLERGDLAEYVAVGWFPDGQRVVIAATEPGRDVSLYLQDVPNGTPTAISEQGIRVLPYSSPVSPDGQYVAAVDRADRIVLQPVGGGETQPLPELRPGDRPIRWSGDGESLYVFRGGQLPGSVFRFRLAERELELLAELRPSDSAGVTGIFTVQITADGQTYLFSYTQELSDLYVVDGLE